MISFLADASQVVLFLLGTFLIIVILLQRGRGGGLAGAFGGMGGQSAFGTKAGDVFTRITIVLAVCWVILAGGSGYLLRAASRGTHGDEYGPGKAATTETEGTGSEGALGTAGGTSADGIKPGDTTPPAGSGATPAPSPGGPATSDGNTEPPGTPAPANTPDAGNTGTPSAETPAPAGSTPDQPAPSPQDK